MKFGWMTAVVGLALLGSACASSALPVGPGPTRTIQSFDGLTLAYDDRGEGDSLLFIHGMCCERGFWAESAGELAEDYRVITMDLGGHGESGRNRAAWKLSDMASDVVAVVEHLELSELILVGHSMGGPTALLAAEQLPGRVHGVVAVDALHDPAMKMDLVAMEPFLELMADDYEGFWHMNVGSAFLPDADPAIIERVLEVANDTPFAVANGLMLSFAEYDATETLRACRVPVRCINASMSPTLTEASQAIATDFDAVLMEGVGHFPMLDAPEEFNRELRRVLSELSSL